MKNILRIMVSVLAGVSAVAGLSACEKGGNPDGKVKSLDAIPKTLNFVARGAVAQTVTVTAVDVEWSVTVVEEWLHVEKSSGGISVTVDDNYAADARKGVVTITPADTDVALVDIVVNQAGSSDVNAIKHAIGAYRQDFHDNGLYNFFIGFYTGDVDEYGFAASEGLRIEFDFFADKPASEVRPDIKPGVYTVNASKALNTAIAWDNATGGSNVTTIDAAMQETMVGIASGTLTVHREGDDYIFIVDVVLTDGKPFIAYYKGAATLRNPFMTTFTENFEITGIKSAKVIYYADAWGSGTCYWYIEFAGPGLTLSDTGGPAGSGDFFRFEFYSPLEGASKTTLPTGEYEFITSQPTTKAAWTCVGGYYGFGAGGSWYYYIQDELMLDSRRAPIVSGVLKISKAGDNHTIALDAYDDGGNNVKSSFSGPISIINYSGTN